MMDFGDVRQACSEIKVWKTIRINHEKKEVASILYKPAKCKMAFRIVVTCHKRKDGQIDL